MSDINDASAQRIYRLNGINNKKKLFERLAEILAEASDQSFEKVLDSLTSRERMGSTCIGDGVAIPHCKLPIEKPVGAILQLDEAIECGNKEDKVSLIFGYVIPEDQCKEHLSLLSAVATLCREDNWLEQIKAVKEQSQLHAIIEQSGLNLLPYTYEARHT